MNKLIAKYKNLTTVEQRSFWTIAPVTMFIGLAYVITIPFIFSNLLTYVGAFLCMLGPLALMIFCGKTKNYNISYPILCIVVGGLAVPICFITNGGFYSGMPICCSAGCITSAFCYNSRARYISFLFNMVSNFLAFTYVDKFGAVNMLKGPDEIEFDMVLTFAIIAISVFIVVNFVVGELRNYVISDDAMKKFIDDNVRNEIIRKANHGDLNENGERKNVVVVFADLSSFTTTTENMDIDNVTKYLNIFLSIVENKVHANGGIVDKFIGDCAMAYWIDEDAEGTSVLKAIKALSEIQNEIGDQSGKIQRLFKTTMNFHAGLDIGPVILGGIGSETRKDYTIIGDTVNAASRIDEIAKAGEIIISENAAELIKDIVNLNPIEEDVNLKGKSKSIKLYKLVNDEACENLFAEKNLTATEG